MVFGGLFRGFTPVFDPGGAAALPWWLSGGVAADNCFAAYKPKGAASLAASYDNNAAPGNGLADGTYDCTLGVAPTFDPLTGWMFNGSTQWLNTGIDGTLKPVSYIARIALGGSGYRPIIGTITKNGWEWRINATTNKQNLLKQDTTSIGTSTSAGDGVIAVTYSAAGAYAFYLSGVADGSGTNDKTGETGAVTLIGRKATGTDEWFAGNILCLAVYNVVLTPAQVLAVSTAMAAL